MRRLVAGRSEQLRHDLGIGLAVEADGLESARVAYRLAERSCDRPATRAGGHQHRAVDIEKDELPNHAFRVSFSLRAATSRGRRDSPARDPGRNGSCTTPP